MNSLLKRNLGKILLVPIVILRSIQETEVGLTVPRGFTGKLIRFCRDNKVEYNFTDARKKLPEIFFSFQAQLREHQETVLQAVLKKDLGVIVAPPGSGK